MTDSRINQFLCSPLVNAFFSAVLASLYGMFAWAHYLAFLKTPDPGGILVVISESIVAILYISRRKPQTVSLEPVDWMLAFAGTYVPLAFRPTDEVMFAAASYVMAIGVLMQILGLISLNRSFALVAAKRAIKTDFMYRMVRHPIYASYVIIFSSYLLVYPSVDNLMVFAVLIPCMIGRIYREEAHLSQDPSYREYMQRVRYRLIPGVF